MYSVLSRLLALIVLSGMVTACGGRARLHPHTVQAPTGIERWEPSGAVVIDEKLWVANDREGWIAAYPLPLDDGLNIPLVAHQLRPPLERVKWEGAAPGPDGSLLLLEAISRTVWRCDNPQIGCKTLTRVDTGAVNSTVNASIPVPTQYVTFEGLASDGDHIWIGTRGLVPQGKETYELRAWSLVLDRTGGHAYNGAPWMIDGKPYALSDIAVDGDVMYMTWSYEFELDFKRTGVSGLLARATLDPQTRLPGVPELCQMFVGKPEGLADWGRNLVVVFDNDRARKNPTNPETFDLNDNQDYARVVPKSACNRTQGAKPEGESQLRQDQPV